MLPSQRNRVSLPHAIADANGDGLADLVFGGRTNGPQVWLATADGRLEVRPSAFPPLSDTTLGIALADFDGDGDLDMAFANRALICLGPTCVGAADRLLWNDGSGSFTSAGGTFPFDDSALSSSVAAGDVDGDGDVDLVFGRTAHVYRVFPTSPSTVVGGANELWLNDGLGNFTTSAGLPADEFYSGTVVLMDLDGDGDLDLYVANAGAGAPAAGPDQIYFNDGTGTFVESATALLVDTENEEVVLAVDIDGDGDVDLVKLLTDLRVRLLRNTGGVFAYSAGLPAVLGVGIDGGDLDADGDIDLTIRVGNQLQPLLNNGAGFFALAPALDREVLGGAVLFDLDADGDLDVVSTADGLRDHSTLLNDGTGALTLIGSDLPNGVFNQLDGAVVDIDADGDLDLVAASTGSGQNSVYRNEGDGSFVTVSAGDFTVDSAETHGLAVGDLDGDGDQDVLCASLSAPTGGSGMSQLYLNDGSGVLMRATTPRLFAASVALGDLDGDGDLDAYFGVLGADRVFMNSGAGVFTARSTIGSDSTLDVALVDLDGDGDLDAATAGWVGGLNHVYLNDGTGVFTETPGSLPADRENTQSVAAADVDNDGDVDLVFANDGEANRLYLNNGSGIFSDASNQLPGDLSRTLGVVAVDIENDGDLDLLEASFFGATPSRLLLNDGAGMFTVQPGGLPEITNYAHRFLPGDLDGDGDLDAALVTQGPPHVYWNTRRQIAWRNLPRVGATFTLDLYGRASEVVILGASLTTANAPLPPIGNVRLGSTGLAVIEIGTFDTMGRKTLNVPVPNDPALAGLDLYWQFLSGPPLRFSNVEVTRIRNL